MTLPTPKLEERLRLVSRELCSALCAVIHSAFEARGEGFIGSPRPVQLTAALGLDKSLASRVARALASEDELRALLCIPTPQGLTLISGAAREAGATSVPLRALEHATESYRAVLAEFTGGRSDLEATLSGWIPEQRARAEREARRSVFRGMATLSGTRASTIYNALYLVPSEDPEWVDSVVVGVRQDLRKLRSDAKLLVANLRASPDSDPSVARRYTLDGRPLTEDPAAIVLPDLCSHPVPRVAVEEWQDEIAVEIAEGAVDVNEFTTLGFAWRTTRHFEAFASEDRSVHHLTTRTFRPAESLVLDLFLHRALETETPPVATIAAEPREPRRRHHGPGREGRMLVDLDRAPGGLASADVRACPAIAETVCREASLDPGEFRKYRARVELPLPSEELTLWWARRARPQPSA